MDYFSVIVLLIVTVIFATDRKPKSIEEIEINNKKIKQEIVCVKDNIQVLKKDFNNISYDEIKKSILDIDKKYILIQNSKVQITEEEKEILIANFINSKYKICAFNLRYVCNQDESIIKKLYINILNYINIFNKKDLSSYGVVILAKENIVEEENIKFNEIISYVTNDVVKITIDYSKQDLDEIKKMQIQGIKKGNLEIIIKLLFLIISGIYITANLLKAILDFKSFQNLIVLLVIYLCYSYVVRYVYEPIGRQRLVAKYMFPIYFITYIIISMYYKIRSFIKKVQAS